ncbi:hypothetical protein AM1_5967 [Acaryochloris marina MBIC11017]|uniref:Uncharacterized protein n=1 Tax=Acaryochloris marina (strain MBIC 11017) TaxID=329726 RepID=B0C2L5_ACAM1|nr:hypothetical protein AM1_5967 [Acaryochloris marina MBIC11017]
MLAADIIWQVMTDANYQPPKRSPPIVIKEVSLERWICFCV